MDGGEKFFMYTALSGGAMAHEYGYTQDDGIFCVVFEDFSFGHELCLPVEVFRAGHVGRAIGLVGMAVKDHVCRNMKEARAEVGCDLRELPGQGDVYFFCQLGVRVDICGIGDGCAVDDNIGP